jgi:hypothetical protein
MCQNTQASCLVEVKPLARKRQNRHQSHRSRMDTQMDQPNLRQRQLIVSDKASLRQYYEDAFKEFNQANCRLIAKDPAPEASEVSI